MGRFINADAFVSTGQGFTGNNMFAYCGNNPVSRRDSAGSRHDLATAVAYDGRTTGAVPDNTVAGGSVDVYIVPYGDGKRIANQLANTADAVVVEDRRDAPESGNPCMRIYHSDRITDSALQREILEAIIDYNDKNPSINAWTREINEMEYEWDYHNSMAKFSALYERARHVDLDENDKNKSFIQKGVEILWQQITGT